MSYKGAHFDNRTEYELSHPPAERPAPGLPRISDAEKRRAFCQTCLAEGRSQVAHDALPDGRGICRWHRDGVPLPGERPRPAQTSAAAPAQGSPPAATPASEEQHEEEAVARKNSETCSRGCGRPRHRGNCRKPEKAQAARKLRDRMNELPPPVELPPVTVEPRPAAAVVNNYAPGGAADGPVAAEVLMSVPVRAINQWFEALEPERRRDILERVWDDLPAAHKAVVFEREFERGVSA